MFFQLENLTYRHPGTNQETAPALKNISLSIAEGEWVALVGANGSGKTTLALHLNALLQPSSGCVFVDDLDTRLVNNLATIRSRVGMVFQSPEDQIVASLVSEDTAFGPENLALTPRAIQTRTQEALNAVHMWDERERSPHLLSAGQIQRVALAGVLAMQPRCLIFDETTAMLDPVGKREVLEQMRRLHQQGLTIVMITHSMDEAVLAERAILLDQGQLVFDGDTEKLFEDKELLKHCHLELPSKYQLIQLIHKYFPAVNTMEFSLDNLSAYLPVNTSEQERSNVTEIPSSVSPELIRVEEVQHTYFNGTPLAQKSLRGVTMHTLQGETHGLVGATGSGKSTLLQHFNGLYLPQTGEVQVGRFNLNDPNVDLHGLRRFAGLVFQNPELYFFEQYVGDEIAYGAKLFFGREGLRERVRNAMVAVGLDFEAFKDRMTNTLSGGEKRKVALASALVVEPELLILDEPTAGLDPLSRRELLKTLKGLQASGRSIVISSHNMEDITALAQEMTVLQQGKSLITGRVGEIFNDEALIQEAGLVVPTGASLVANLRKNGWPVPLNVATIPGVEIWLDRYLKGGSLEPI